MHPIVQRQIDRPSVRSKDFSRNLTPIGPRRDGTEVAIMTLEPEEPRPVTDCMILYMKTTWENGVLIPRAFLFCTGPNDHARQGQTTPHFNNNARFPACLLATLPGHLNTGTPNQMTLPPHGCARELLATGKTDTIWNGNQLMSSINDARTSSAWLSTAAE